MPPSYAYGGAPAAPPRPEAPAPVQTAIQQPVANTPASSPTKVGTAIAAQNTQVRGAVTGQQESIVSFVTAESVQFTRSTFTLTNDGGSVSVVTSDVPFTTIATVVPTTIANPEISAVAAIKANGPNIPAMAGGVVGALIFLVAVILTFLYCRRRGIRLRVRLSYTQPKKRFSRPENQHETPVAPFNGASAEPTAWEQASRPSSLSVQPRSSGVTKEVAPLRLVGGLNTTGPNRSHHLSVESTDPFADPTSRPPSYTST